MDLKAGEVLEDLQRDNLYILQNKNNYRFAVDSVLLAHFAKVKSTDFVVEFCSGCGVVSILNNAIFHPKSILGLEIDPELCDMAKRSVEYNKIDNIKFICMDVKDCLSVVDCADVIICNPPYYKKVPKNTVPKNLIAKYEIKINLEQILKLSSLLLKPNGILYMSYPVMRLQELMFYSKKYNLIAKNLQIEGKFLLVKFVKGANDDLKLTLHNPTK